MLLSTGCSNHSPQQHWSNLVSLSNKGVQSSFIFMHLTAAQSLCGQVLSGNLNKMLLSAFQRKYFTVLYFSHIVNGQSQEKETLIIYKVKLKLHLPDFFFGLDFFHGHCWSVLGRYLLCWVFPKIHWKFRVITICLNQEILYKNISK